MKIKLLSQLILFIISIYLEISFQEKIISDKTFYLLINICKNNSVFLIDYGIIENPEYVESNKIGFGNYTILLYSTNNSVLLQYNFSQSFKTHREIIDPITGEMKGEEVEFECLEKYFRFPYLKDLSKIEMFNFDQKILETKICNENSVCEKKLGENEINCNDCKLKICPNLKDNYCEPNCPEDPDCKEYYIPPISIFILLIIAIAIITFIMYTKRINKVKLYKKTQL
ncbi:MAG: hypothetical protein QXP34_01545 [Candidatus Aenigmatarchaeota archaeon]